jgi:Rrf2 family protein
MLRISKKADYAVFVLGSIARRGAFPGGDMAGAVVSAQEISKQAGLNKSVIANLLKEFAKHGVLESVRGLRGGYRLVRHPREINLAEVLEIVEGPFTLVDCIRQAHAAGTDRGAAADPLLPLGDHQCSLISFCPTKNPMRVVHERIATLFRQIRLDELCGLHSQRAPAAAGSHR